MSVNSKMKAIADAIRAKTGGTAALTLDGMAEAVAGIEAGGGDDLLKAIMEKTLTGSFNDQTFDLVGAYGLSYQYNLTDVSLAACKKVLCGGFYMCTVLHTVNLPVCATVELDAFSSCYALKSVNLPACTSIGNQVFKGCSGLESICLPSCRTLNEYAFNSCSILKHVDLPACTSLGRQAFSYCKSLTTVILRAESVCKMASTNVFGGCNHIEGTVDRTYNPEGLKDGYIYVPDALVDSYKAATNWSTYASQIKPLSEYVEVTA